MPTNKENGALTPPFQYAKEFHELYEKYAPEFGYETRADTKQFDSENSNGKLMAKVCYEIIEKYRSQQLTQERERINKMWLSLNLRNDNKENWSKELDKYGVFMQSLNPKKDI